MNGDLGEAPSDGAEASPDRYQQRLADARADVRRRFDALGNVDVGDEGYDRRLDSAREAARLMFSRHKDLVAARAEASSAARRRSRMALTWVLAGICAGAAGAIIAGALTASVRWGWLVIAAVIAALTVGLVWASRRGDGVAPAAAVVCAIGAVLSALGCFGIPTGWFGLAVVVAIALAAAAEDVLSAARRERGSR